MGTLIKIIYNGVLGVFAIYGLLRFWEDHVESERSGNDMDLDLDA